MPGVISIPHGYGHDRMLPVLTEVCFQCGVSVNDITDDQIVDPVTGNAAFSGQRVSVTKASEPEVEETAIS